MRTRISKITATIALLASIASTQALATEAVVAPLLPSGVDPLIALNITSLVSSEMDFSPDYEHVTQLQEAPETLDRQCVNRSNCLRPIGQAQGVNHLVTGTVGNANSEEFELYLVLYDVDRGRFIRKKTFNISKSPDMMADSVMGIVHELLTGQAPAEEEPSLAEANGFDSWEDEEEDFFFEEDDADNRLGTPGNSTNTLSDFDDEEDDWEQQLEIERQERERREEAEREEELRREEERRAEDQRRRDEERRAEDQRRRDEERRAEDQRRRDEERRAEQARRDAEIDDSDDFQFGAVDPDDIGIEDFEFGSAVSDITVDDDYSSFDDSDDWESQTLSYDDELDSLDGPEPEESRTSSRRDNDRERERDRDRERESSRSIDSASRTPRVSSSTPYIPRDSDLSIRLNAGLSKYQTLSFLTSGVEASFAIGDSLTFDAGVEAQSTERRPTAKQQRDLGLPPQLWNTILPVNFGLTYVFSDQRIAPSIGADLILAPYTRDFDIALGARLRGGVDYMITSMIGINATLSAGAIYGSEWSTIDEGLTDFSIMPQFTIGTLFAI